MNCRMKLGRTLRQRLGWHNTLIWAYAVKTALQSMTKPDKHLRHPSLVWCFGYQELPTTALCFGDANFTARETGVRSKTGTAMVFGRCPPEVTSPTQSRRALSTRGSTHSPRQQHTRSNLLASCTCWDVPQVRWTAAMPRQASGLQVVRAVASHVTSRQSGSVSRTSSQRIVSWCPRR